MRKTISEIRGQASGRWLDILASLAPGMFEPAIQHLGRHVACPFHGGASDFRFLKYGKPGFGNTAQVGVAMCTCGVYHSGFAVLERANGWTFATALRQVDEWLNGTATHPVYRTATACLPRQVAADEEAARKAGLDQMVHKLWSTGKPLDLQKTAYYAVRGIRNEVVEEARDLRFLPSLGHFQEVAGELTNIGSFPAILALLRNAAGQPVAVHRTWLSRDGKEKAPVAQAKKLTRTAGVVGAAIRLYEVADSSVLGITEGIETAHAVRQLARDRYWPELSTLPVWACFAERNVRAFSIPPELLGQLTTIIVFADNDENGKGMEAAEAFKARMASLHPALLVDIRMPLGMGQDWNDVLLNTQ